MTILKGILLLCVSIIPMALSGCAPAIIEEVVMGVIEGIIHELEEYREHPHKKDRD
jgi:hypothetical protein